MRSRGYNEGILQGIRTESFGCNWNLVLGQKLFGLVRLSRRLLQSQAVSKWEKRGRGNAAETSGKLYQLIDLFLG